MARKTKDARPGRVTPKGTQPGGRRTPGGGSAAPSGTTSGRYTAPIPNEFKTSPKWVPALMLAFFLVGIAVIVLNYLNLINGHASNSYLFIGLGLIVAGFITSTRWH